MVERFRKWLRSILDGNGYDFPPPSQCLDYRQCGSCGVDFTFTRKPLACCKNYPRLKDIDDCGEWQAAKK